MSSERVLYFWRRDAAILVACAASALSQRAVAATQLPIPCVAGACGPTVTALATPPAGTKIPPTAVQNGNTLTVNQGTLNDAILNWSSFNVGAGGKVTFIQPTATSIALNRIFQGSPSTIFGQVTANGQIYLINPNGILFGSTAQVNTSGLIAASLGISDAVFNAGILSPQVLAGTFGSKAALSGDVPLAPGGNPSGADNSAVSVDVEKGATISTQGGRILLAAPVVQNNGTLSAPDGQVVLAAGTNVYLLASEDPSLRGLIVEVDGAGTASNQVSGVINTARGNTTMVGLAVNQDGRISATTAVTANGSVRLEAANTAAVNGGGGSTPFTLTSQVGGTLELGPQSSIEILPELSSTATAVPDQAPAPSRIDLLGQEILVHGTNIVAPGGELNVLAAANPGAGLQTDGNALAQIRIDADTNIDLSGTSVELPMSANLVPIQLRANELADDPTQRNGALRGLTVYVDARVGSPLISSAALSGALGTIAESIGQFDEPGGHATFQSEGDVVIQPGATINVSGGHTTYDGGFFQTSVLVGLNGQLYDIGTANPLLTYTGVVNPTFTQSYNKWGIQSIVDTPGLSHYEAGYVEGASAGSITIAAPSLVLQGTLVGTATNGALQRNGGAASGGQLVIGLPGGLTVASNSATDFLAPGVEFVNQATPVIVSDGEPLPPQTVQLPIEYLGTGGFTSTKIYSNGTVNLPDGLPLALLPGASLSIEAPRINLDSSIVAPGGSINLQNVATVDAANVPRMGVQIGDDVTLDVSGQWTNDFLTAFGSPIGTGQILANGGTINISPGVGTVGGAANVINGSQLVLGNDVSLLANGGAWLQTTGSVVGGKGGSISLVGAALDAGLQIGNGVGLQAFGVGGAAGGSFSLTAPRVSINNGSTWAAAQSVDDLAPAGGNAPGGVFTVGAALFDGSGFSSVSLTANGPVPASGPNNDVLTVQAGTTVTPLTQSLALIPGYLLEPTGANLAAFSQAVTLPVGVRTPANLALSATPQTSDPTLVNAGSLDVQKGASIVSDPGASITLTSVGGIYVDGTIRAPGGAIGLHIQAPDSPNDPGYLPTLAIELGPQGVLDAGGAFVPTQNNQGLELGTVVGGGAISLIAARGSVLVDSGSEINISGSSAPVDVAGQSAMSYTRYTVPSAGGSLVLSAPESISLLGTLTAQAGSGNYGEPAAGSLEVDLTRSINFGTSQALLPTFPTSPRIIELIGDLPADSMPSVAASGLALLGVSQLASSGIDSLTLQAGDEILFSTSLPLTLARELVLNAPSIAIGQGLNPTVTTNYAEIGNLLPTASPAVATPGAGTFTVNADQIDLVGSLVLQGVGTAHFNSAGDITLRDEFSGSSVFGSLAFDSNLVLSAARIYPATGSTFSITAVHDPVDPSSTVDTVSLTQSTPSAGTPLSAGGSVAITADVIQSSGTLLAPFGSIDLNASKTLNLEAGSLTSVSGAGLTLPYGLTELGGQEWLYTPAGGASIPVAGIPARAVSLNAPTLSVAAGATVNLAGGGDLYAYEWVPGTGGTVDALGQNAATGLPNVAGLYAVLPSTRGQFAPYDPEETPVSGLSAGASIYLSGGAGLAAGIYPLLPARDALVPGAFLVQVQTSGYGDILPGKPQSLADNTPVIAGYLTFGTTGLHSGSYEGVAVWPGSYGQTLAQYQISDASTYFSALAVAAGDPTPPLPADAGSLSIAVSNSLSFLGNVQGNLANSTGLGSQIDISAPQLVVTGPGSSPAAGAVAISGSVIQSWNAGQLVLGGHPTTISTTLSDGSVSSSTSIGVTASTVTVDSGVQLSANQVILVANQSIDLEPGSAVVSSSALAGGSAPSQLPASNTLVLNSPNAAGAALLAVSDLSLPIVQRSSDAAGGATIAVETGARVASLGALSLDGPGGVDLAGTLSGRGASWSLASDSIGFVGSGTSTDTLQITTATQSEMQDAAAIRIASTGAIDLYAPVVLGLSATSTPTLDALTLSGDAIVNQGSAGGSFFGAKTVTIAGSAIGNVASAPIAAPGGGALNLVSDELDIAANPVSVVGFQNTAIVATSAVVGRNSGAPSSTTGQPSGGIVTGGNLSITAPLITVLGGMQTALDAPLGTLSVSGPVGPNKAPVIAGDLGGELDINGNALQLSGALVVPSGIITARAVQDVVVAGSAVIDAGGRTLDIAGTLVGSEGGAVMLAAGGNLSIAAGAQINVAGAGTAPAGSVALTAGSAANLQGTLLGQGGTGAQGGSFSVEAGTLNEGLTPLVNTLQAGGFTAVDSVIAHTGNLVLSAGSNLAANQVTLVADAGSVEIGGTVTAANADLRGSIGVYGGAGVTIDPTGQLHADTTGGAGIGGEIDLGTATGTITLGSGSVLSATGPNASGTLLVRAPIVGSDVAIANKGASLGGFGQIFVEPIITMAIGTTLTAADFSTLETSVDTTMSTLSPTVTARLNPTGALPLTVRPAVDLTQAGSLTLPESLDLSTNTAVAGAMDLTLRAGGAITIGMSDAGGNSTPVIISDGFNTGDTGALALIPGPSSSLRFVAGANASSPDPLALIAGSGANLTLQPNSIVRTGTGEIDLTASGTITFAPPATSGDSTPLVYTAGINPVGAGGQPIAGIAVPTTNFVFNFPSQGGAIRISAEGDILGAPVQQSVTGWQIREGNGAKIPTQWGVDLDQFGWNVGSFGGGDVAVSAGGSILELSAAAADSDYNSSATGTSVYTSSGGLAVTAGGDIGSSQFFLAKGSSLLRAGGGFTAVEPVPGDATNAGSTIALGDAQVVVQARTGIILDAILNPTANVEVLADSKGKLFSYFFTYGEDSSVALQTTAGNVSLLNDGNHQTTLMGPGASTLETYGSTYPASFTAVSLLQDVDLAAATLFPSDSGQLEIIAGRDVIGGAQIVMSDAPASAVPSLTSPVKSDSNLGPAIDVPFYSGRHVDDPAPALVVAGRDIVDLSLDVPKAADLIAGRDITGLAFLGQNLNLTDLTLISAGRDFIDPATGAAGGQGTVQVGGPGQVDVLAGRNVDLGFSNGITTVGNSVNDNLSTSAGANLTVMAGLGGAADQYSNFLTKIIAPDATNQGLLVAYVESLTGQSGLSYAAASTEFLNLSADQQRPLIDQIFFDTLSISGLQANNEPQLGFTTGYAAIDALYPNSRTASATGPSPYSGDISLTFSRIYTTNGGTISLLAPGGGLDVGLANPPALLQSKAPSQLGIVAQGTGDVDIYSQGDVDVNSSRIFTLGGGNILIWSDQGSIDAGRGSKSSVSAPPPVVQVDASGNVTLDFTGAVAGSGIRTIQINSSVNPGNVDLVAPEGTVNAGDAGIGAAGDINIAALHVVGLDNITFGGTSTGVPAQVSNIGVTLAGASSTASSASNAATTNATANGDKEAAVTPLAQAALSWLDVFVTGLGEENCKPDDIDCLKRQKAPTR